MVLIAARPSAPPRRVASAAGLMMATLGVIFFVSRATIQKGFPPLRGGPFLRIQGSSVPGNGSFRNRGDALPSSPCFPGKDSLFPLPVCRKTGTAWRFQVTAPAFPHGADTTGKAGLPEPASRATVRTGRDGSCGHKKKTVPGKDRPRFFRGRTPLFGVFPQHINHLLLRADHAGVDEFLDIGIGLQNGFGGILGFAVPGVEPDDEAAGVIRIERVVAAG